jgi:hypothetical protein
VRNNSFDKQTVKSEKIYNSDERLTNNNTKDYSKDIAELKSLILQVNSNFEDKMRSESVKSSTKSKSLQKPISIE